jgi:hypothetical protein
MRQQQSIIGNLDWPLFITFILMIFMGLATVYSVSFNEEHPFLFDLSQTYGKQVLWIGVSLFLGLMVFLIDSDVYRKFCVPIYLFTIGLLVIVLFMPPVHGNSTGGICKDWNRPVAGTFHIRSECEAAKHILRLHSKSDHTCANGIDSSSARRRNLCCFHLFSFCSLQGGHFF